MDSLAPKYCVWEITLRCNMRCMHCGSSAGSARKDELSVDECLPVAADLLRLGCRQVTFIGGEVFLAKAWEQIARYMSDGGARTNIITNAYSIGDREIDRIREAGLSNVGISLDGMERNHDRIRGKKGSFKRAMEAIARLNRASIPIGIVTSLLDFNAGDLEEMHALLTGFGVKLWQIQIVTNMGKMLRNRKYLIGPSKIGAITRFIRDRRGIGGMSIYAGDDIGYFDENELYLRGEPGSLTSWGGCQAGISVIGIDSVGNVKGCESMYSDEFIEGNLREETLEEIWTKEGNFSYNRNFDVSMLVGNCAGCDKGERCRGGCHGSSYFNSGSMFESIYCNYPGRPGYGRDAADRVAIAFPAEGRARRACLPDG